MAFSPSTQAEPFQRVSGLVIFYSGDSLRASFGGGLTYNYHFNKTFWLGADLLAFTTHRDPSSGLIVRDGKGFWAMGANAYYNLPILLGDNSDPKQWHADLYTSAGGGLLLIDKENEIYGQIGGGLVAYPPKIAWLALHFDLKNLFYMLKNNGGDDFNIDMILNLGPSFIF